MSAHKHTPGPWYFAPRMNLQSGLMIYAEPHGVTVAAVPHNDSTGRADAALIAAAPELLAAAKKAYDFLKSEAPIPESQFKVLCDLAVAIERAGGEA